MSPLWDDSGELSVSMVLAHAFTGCSNHIVLVLFTHLSPTYRRWDAQFTRTSFNLSHSSRERHKHWWWEFFFMCQRKFFQNDSSLQSSISLESILVLYYSYSDILLLINGYSTEFSVAFVIYTACTTIRQVCFFVIFQPNISGYQWTSV